MVVWTQEFSAPDAFYSFDDFRMPDRPHWMGLARSQAISGCPMTSCMM
jgi:hypothetical protein